MLVVLDNWQRHKGSARKILWWENRVVVELHKLGCLHINIKLKLVHIIILYEIISLRQIEFCSVSIFRVFIRACTKIQFVALYCVIRKVLKDFYVFKIFARVENIFSTMFHFFMLFCDRNRRVIVIFITTIEILI